MTIGLSKLAAVERLTAWATKYDNIQLHVGDPGANGTANVAAESTRIAVTWGTPDDSVAGVDRKSTPLNSSHTIQSRMPSSA